MTIFMSLCTPRLQIMNRDLHLLQITVNYDIFFSNRHQLPGVLNFLRRSPLDIL